MVVPPANGIDLLKEHAYHEYGNKEFQSVLNFDYSFAIDQSVSHKPFDISTIGILVFVGIILSFTIKKLLNHKETIKPQYLQDDLESQLPPQLSRSSTSTPQSSPLLSQNIFGLSIYNPEDSHLYKQA